MQPFQGVSDIRSIEAPATGYHADLDHLVNSYSNMVYQIAVVQLKNRADADDAYQDVFMQLVRYADRLQSDEHAKAWLIRVTINRCKKHFLSSWYKRNIPLADYDAPTNGMNVEQRELYELVMALPTDQRMVTHLYYYEGYSVEEISSLLNRKANTVKSQLLRARKALKNKLDEGEMA